ncbi:unnamed protein product [Closterium sp. NIES-53]
MWSAASAPAGPRGPLVTFGDLVGDLTAEETREFVDRGDFDDREGGVQERGKLRRRRRRSQQQQEQPRGEGGDVVTGSSAPSLLPRPASPPLALPASPHAARASHVTRHMLLSSFEASLDDFRSSLSEPGHAWTRFTAQVSQPRPHCDMPCRAVPCPALPWRAVPRRAVPCLAML